MLEWVLMLLLLLILAALAAGWYAHRTYTTLTIASQGTTPNREMADLRSELPGRHMSRADRLAVLRVWKSVSCRFEDDPRTVLVYADLLVSDLIRDETGALSRNEGRLRQEYVKAHNITKRVRQRPLKPEESRLAMTLYTDVMNEFLRHKERCRESQGR